jgi:hypothetical protein
MLARPLVQRGNELSGGLFSPGDILGGGESLTAGAIATVGAGTLTGNAIATGIINRTGPTAGYTDTTDTAQNILLALAGNAPDNSSGPGTTFRLLFVNTVAFAMTFAVGVGVVAGGGVRDVAASTWREYLFTILNDTPQVSQLSQTTNASPTVTFVLQPGQTALTMGSNIPFVNITPGMIVTGTGIPANTTVLGIRQGQSGLIGVTLSANATATSPVGGVSLIFGPTIRVDGLRSGTL